MAERDVLNRDKRQLELRIERRLLRLGYELSKLGQEVEELKCRLPGHTWHIEPDSPVRRLMDSDLPELIQICQSHPDDDAVECLRRFEQEVCPKCHLADTKYCPCPMNYWLPLTIQTIRQQDQVRPPGTSAMGRSARLCVARPEVTAAAL